MFLDDSVKQNHSADLDFVNHDCYKRENLITMFFKPLYFGPVYYISLAFTLIYVLILFYFELFAGFILQTSFWG